MASLLYQKIEQISREKHMDPEVIVAAIEDAMIVAARKYYKTEECLRGKFNAGSGQIDVFAVRPVVEEVTEQKKEFTLAEAKRIDPSAVVGSEVVIPKPTDVLGRIAAQTAKQVIMQKVREAERDTIYNEYNGRVGELVNCVVKRTEGPDVIVDLGRAEARMPKREQSRLETYNISDPETRHLEIIVEDTQLSLAIGKKGQNVRLASKLIGWNVDIKSEEEKRQEIEAQMAALTAPGTPLSELKGVGPKTIERIETHGVTTIEKLADMTPEQLTEIPGIGEKMVEKIQLSVAAYFQSLEN